MEIRLSEIIGKGYKTFWESKKRYRVLKGSRGSKKSKTTALWTIYNMMKHKESNTLVIRKVFNSLRDSCYSDLLWAIERLGVSHLWKSTKSPLELVYKPTGQKILFRGLDDPLKLTSITVEKGYLCWVWIEEAYELMSEDAFNKLDLSIRGKLPEHLWKQITFTFNPWNEKHWLKARFFDVEDEDILALTTTYKINEFLDDDDRKVFEKMKRDNPKRYRVEGEAEWGIAEGLIFENWEEKEFDYREISKRKGVVSRFGLDFGYTNDPSAFTGYLEDEKNKEIYVFDEFYKSGMLNDEIANQIKYMGYAKEEIIGDSSEQKSIEEIKRYGIRRIRPSVKGKDSVLHGIQLLQQYKIYIHPKCVNTITEFSSYIWDTKDNKALNKPVDAFNHIIYAMRYAIYKQPKKGIDVERLLKRGR